MKTLAIIWTAAIISGFGAASYVNNTINALLVKPVDEQSSLSVVPADPAGQALTAYQVQGGNRQTIQVTATPQTDKNTIQGNQEDGDNLQPAIGYGGLNWKMQ